MTAVAGFKMEGAIRRGPESSLQPARGGPPSLTARDRHEPGGDSSPEPPGEHAAQLTPGVSLVGPELRTGRVMMDF